MDEYVNGLVNMSGDLCIGGTISGGNALECEIEEFRIINGMALSANWVQTEYNNQNSPETFSLASIEESNVTEVISYLYSNGFSLPIYGTPSSTRPLLISTPVGLGALELVELVSSEASPFRIATSSGIKSIEKVIV